MVDGGRNAVDKGSYRPVGFGGFGRDGDFGADDGGASTSVSRGIRFAKSTGLKPGACRCQFAFKNQLELIVSGRGEAVLLPAAVFPEGDGAADFSDAACVHVREE